MSARVVVYRLRTRYLQEGGQPPEVSKQIVYYSLALGHHVGVIDTFQTALSRPLDAYLAWVETLPDGEARRKLDGVRRFGEIMVDSSHTPLLLPALRQAVAEARTPEHAELAGFLESQVHDIEREPALYLMVRRVS